MGLLVLGGELRPDMVYNSQHQIPTHVLPLSKEDLVNIACK
jgi:hypothetical protein